MKYDAARVQEIFCSPSLQMVSFTITEKGYSLRDAKKKLIPAVAQDMQNGPSGCKAFMAQLTALCIQRMHACSAPLALVSMDNCSHNGQRLQAAVMEIAEAWLANGKITADEIAYLKEQVSFPWSMIDKITPRPNPSVEAQLIEDGLEGISPFVTSKNTYIAAFVNAEKPQYLVIENLFPNGRPPLDEAGVIFTDRETVNKVEKMKVCTCLNPLHTCLAVYGCLLGYTSIAAEMKDEELFLLYLHHEPHRGHACCCRSGNHPAGGLLKRGSDRSIPQPVYAGYPPAHRHRYLPKAADPLRRNAQGIRRFRRSGSQVPQAHPAGTGRLAALPHGY